MINAIPFGGVASSALRAATVGAAITTGALGVEYWLGLNDPVMVVATLIAEIVGVFGLAAAARRLRDEPIVAAAGFVIVAMAVVWSGGTTWAKLDADVRARAVAVAEASPSYLDAQASLTAASEALRRRLAQDPPACVCPATIAAWAQSHEAQIALLEQARADAERRLRDARPREQVRAWDVARAVFFEAVKLFGLLAFGPTTAQTPTPAAGNLKERRLRPPSRTLAVVCRRWRSFVALLGLGTATAQAEIAMEKGAQFGPAASMQREPHKERPELVQRAGRAALREARKSQAREWALAGMPKTEIARRLGVHRNTVHNWLRLG